MILSELVSLYACHPLMGDLQPFVEYAERQDKLYCQGLHGSMGAVVLAATLKDVKRTVVVVMSDEEKAGYFYHDLVKLGLGERVVFLPSSFRNAKTGTRRDTGNEILRNDVLSRLSAEEEGLVVVSFPDAVKEPVASQKEMNAQTVRLKVGTMHDLTELEKRLTELGFEHRDYIYEPGEFAIRGSLLDVYSFAAEEPYRIDFFGDEIETIRTFDVQTQLSKEQKREVAIIPEITEESDLTDLTEYLEDNTLLVTDDYSMTELFEGYSRLELNGRGLPCLTFNSHPQPLFHKNFEMLKQQLLAWKDAGNRIYICADQSKQLDRLTTILEETVTPTGCYKGALHEGFVDDDCQLALLTDHQIFDRFHRYDVKNDHVRNAKMSLTLKELREFMVGDYVVHIDHGVGQFAGLVRQKMDNGDMQEVVKLIYRNNDMILVSIHALHKICKYKGKDGQPPQLSHLGTGAWNRLKERTKQKLKDIAGDLIKLYSERRESEGFAYSPDTFLQQELEASFLYEDTPDQSTVTQQVKADMERKEPMDRLVCGDVGFGKTEIAIRAAFKAACDNKQTVVLVPTTVLALQHFHTFSERLKNLPVKVDYLTRARTATQTKQILKDLESGQTQIIIGTQKLLGKTVKFKDLGLLIIDEEQKFGVSVKEKIRQMRVNIDTLTLTATPIPRTLQFSLMGARDLSVISTPPPNRYPIRTEIHTFGHEILADAINFELMRNGQVFIVTHRISQLSHLEHLIHKYVPEARVAIGHGQMPPEILERTLVDFINHEYDVLLSTTIIENGIDIPNANTIIVDNAHHFGLSDLHQMRGRVGRSNRKAFCYLLAPPLNALPDDSRRRLQAIEQFSDLGSGIHIAMQDLDIRGAGNLLGAEQSGFIADLGYETYQKILSQAVEELRAEKGIETPKNVDTADSEKVEFECDLHAYFPETYIPGSSERVLLYRELDGLHTDEQVDAYRQRLVDRFGQMPKEAEELLLIVPLRRMARTCGAVKLRLRSQKMFLIFDPQLPDTFYQNDIFGQLIQYAAYHCRECVINEKEGQRRMIFNNVKTLQQATGIFRTILNP